MKSATSVLIAACFASSAHAFSAPKTAVAATRTQYVTPRTLPTRNTQLTAMPDDDEPELFGGYTAKQRMREEIESPFRKVRLIFLERARARPSWPSISAS